MKLLLSNSILSVASNRIRIHALELCVIPGYELDTLQHHCLIRSILVSQFELAYVCLGRKFQSGSVIKVPKDLQ